MLTTPKINQVYNALIEQGYEPYFQSQHILLKNSKLSILLLQTRANKWDIVTVQNPEKEITIEDIIDSYTESKRTRIAIGASGLIIGIVGVYSGYPEMLGITGLASAAYLLLLRCGLSNSFHVRFGQIRFFKYRDTEVWLQQHL